MAEKARLGLCSLRNRFGERRWPSRADSGRRLRDADVADVARDVIVEAAGFFGGSVGAFDEFVGFFLHGVVDGYTVTLALGVPVGYLFPVGEGG